MSENMSINYQLTKVLALVILLCCFSHVSADVQTTLITNNTTISQMGISNSTNFGIQQKSLEPSFEKKISSDLLFLIDSNIQKTNPDYTTALNQRIAEKKLEILPSNIPLTNSKFSATNQTNASVIVDIDLNRSAPLSEIDPYVSSVVERNGDDHSVVAWVDLNNLNTLASLEITNNIRSAELSITNNSSVYHDVKYIDTRVGLPPATIGDAKASVKKFRNSSNMILEKKGEISTPRGEAYELASNEGRYIVNENTGVVEAAVFFDTQNSLNQQLSQTRSTNSENIQSSPPISMDDAFKIALNYSENKYKAFFNRTMILTQSQLIDHGSAGEVYSFTWREKINNIFTPNRVEITVDSETGDVISYIGIDQSFNADMVPTISENQAVTKALSAFSLSPSAGVKTDSELIILPIDQNNQRLIWLIRVVGVSKGVAHPGGEVQIDAHTGEVIQIDPFN